MRAVASAILLLLPLASGYCQTQERKLMDRVLKPDTKRETPFQRHSYNAGGSLALRPYSEAKGSFNGNKKASLHEFAFTRSFLGIKNPWLGGKVYNTSDAALLSKFHLPTDKTMPLKTAGAKEFTGAEKKADFGSPVVPTREFIAQPATQGAISQITDKINSKMTIDEVRDLLNKPR